MPRKPPPGPMPSSGLYPTVRASDRAWPWGRGWGDVEEAGRGSPDHPVGSEQPLPAGQALTLIIALDVMRKRVARSLTAFSFSPLSAGTRRPSSSFRERCSATPCLATSSLHVPRSSSFSERLRMVPWSSLLSAGEGVPSSSSPESSVERRRVVLRAWRGGGQDGGAGRAARTERCLGEGGGPPAPQRAGRRGHQLEWQRLAELCRLQAGWAAPIPDPWEEAESPNHRPGPTAPAAPHCPHLTSLSALHPPPDPASGLPLCVPGSTPAHLPRPPWRPPGHSHSPSLLLQGSPKSKATLACGVLRVETPAVASQRPYQAGTVPSLGDRQAMGLGEVKSSPTLPPPPHRRLVCLQNRPLTPGCGGPRLTPLLPPPLLGPPVPSAPRPTVWGALEPGPWPAQPVFEEGLRGECGG